MLHPARSTRRAGVSLTTYIVIVSLLAIGLIPYVLALGRRLVRRYSAADASLERGEGLERVPVRIAFQKEAWKHDSTTGNRWGVDIVGDDDPARDDAGPNYVPYPYLGAGEALYGGHHLGNMPGEWRPADLLNDLTQSDADPRSWGSRCAPTSAVAATAITGAEAFARLTRTLRQRIVQGATPNNLSGWDRARVSGKDAEEMLTKILHRIENRTVTRADMGRVADLLAHVYQDDAWSGASKEAATAMMELAIQGSRPAEAVPSNGREFRDWVNRELKPGEVVRSSVDLDADMDSVTQNQHAVLIGKDAEGREYLYDPYPKSGGSHPQLVYRDEHPNQYDYYLDKMVRYRTGKDGHPEHVVGGTIYRY